MKTKNNIFFTCLDKMQIPAILYLATYDWFCADGSHFCRRPLRAVGSSLWITGWCCHKMAKGGKLEPWKWHVLVHLL